MRSVDHQALGVGNRNADAPGLVPRVSTEAHTGSRPWRANFSPRSSVREHFEVIESNTRLNARIPTAPVLPRFASPTSHAQDLLRSRNGIVALCAQSGAVAAVAWPDMATREQRSAIARLAESAGALLVAPTLIILAVAAVYAVGDAVFAAAPSPKNPGFADSVLASRAVVAAIRIAIIAAAGYVVISVFALVSRRQWLIRVGPVEVSEQVSAVGAENAELKRRLKHEQDRTESLLAELAAADAMLSSTARLGREQC
jgi:hypothetical protein